MRLNRPISLLLMCCAPALAQAELYSWKDASGKTHYGDKPPAGKPQETRKIIVTPPSDAESSRKAFTELQTSDREQQKKSKEETEKTQQEQSQAKQREENCQQAKANLNAIESGQVGFTINAKGERVSLEGDARTAEIARAKKNVDEWCKPAGK
jgi:hypothetical protein